MAKRVSLTKQVEDWLAVLRENGYRLTGPRQAVVQVMAGARHALNPAEIYETARGLHPRLGLVTVYRTLEKLEELNLIQRVHRPDDCYGFVAEVPGHRHLLVCERCGRVTYFGGDQMKGLIEKVEGESGYEIHEHWLQFFGVCGSCRGADVEVRKDG